MGMFDTIRWRGRDWQTKDWDRQLDRILILDDGTAVRHGHEGAHRPFPPNEPHGWINAYTCFDDNPNARYGDLWMEYRLKFTDGALVEVIAVSEAAQKLEASTTDLSPSR